jgi:hypothetical protein
MNNGGHQNLRKTEPNRGFLKKIVSIFGKNNKCNTLTKSKF